MIAFVSNNGWVDGNTADGIRKSFTDEFSDIWVYNLRGNQRTAGELSRKEGGKVFGSGARTGVAVLVAVNAQRRAACRLRYYGVPDYQTREEKLASIAQAHLDSSAWQAITPNESGDWLNQRNDTFGHHPAIGARTKPNRETWHFATYSRWREDQPGRLVLQLLSARRSSEHASHDRLLQPAGGFARTEIGEQLDLDPTEISWSSSGSPGRSRGGSAVVPSRRCVQAASTGHSPNSASTSTRSSTHGLPARTPNTSRRHDHDQHRLLRGGPGQRQALFGPDGRLTYLISPCWGSSSGQFFPRWTYEKASEEDQGSLLDASGDVDELGYGRVDNITDGILTLYRQEFGPQVTKDDIFFYVYGVLHSEQYRTTFAADLKRMLPRIPLAASTDDFEAFVGGRPHAGRPARQLRDGRALPAARAGDDGRR